MLWNILQSRELQLWADLFFIIPTIIISLFFVKSNYTIPILVLAIFLGYGIIGFLDDFIKVKFKRNLGLHAYQKIIFQLSIALIVAVYVYKSSLLQNSIFIPFTTIKLDLGLFIIPFIVLVFLATSNSVNLTDGLDGLAGSVSLVFFIAISFFNLFYTSFFSSSLSIEYLTQMQNINTICFAVSGSLLAFLLFNGHPACIFMGDTGSLALGGLIATICAFSGLSLYIIVIGFMFVLSSVSVIIQVISFKLTKKRVFLMAPFHHHLQHKGMHENKIVVIYIVITILLAVLSGILLMNIL